MGQEARMGFYIGHLLLWSRVLRDALGRNYLSPEDVDFPHLIPPVSIRNNREFLFLIFLFLITSYQSKE